MFKSKKVVLTALALTTVFCAVAVCIELEGRWYGGGSGSTVPPKPTPNAKLIYPFNEWLGDIIDGEFRGAWVDEKHGDYGTFRGDVEWTATKYIARCKGKWTWMNWQGYLIPMGSFEMYFNYKTWTCEGKWLNTHNQDHGGIEGKRVE